MLAVTGDKRLGLRLRYDIRDAPAPIDTERHESAASVKKARKNTADHVECITIMWKNENVIRRRTAATTVLRQCCRRID